MEENSPLMQAIKNEIELGLLPIHGKTIELTNKKEQASLIICIEANNITNQLGREGYRIRTEQRNGKRRISIVSCGEAGLLYGTFHFLRLLQTDSSILSLDITESPLLQLRMLNQWDNLDGSIERGYSGSSIYNWEDLPEGTFDKYIDFARANASIGINAISINNVNADPRILKKEYLAKVAVLAKIFRTYNISLFLSINYASPILPSDTPDKIKKWGGIGHLSTADPLNEDVISWWTNKIGEIYSLIPDFGGFVVKANSEGMPGPQDYGRDHSQGANMLAHILEQYNGILIWRAFVYGQKEEKDRAKHAYNEFKPLDGTFARNVFLQVKNGPLDFQAYEPPHPLFGAMPQTSLMAELQITQEYTGHATYLVYLGHMWQEFFNFNTKYNGQLIISDLLQKQKNMTGISAVANVGNDTNWTGHHFAQANWFAYGRLAWNPTYNADTIASEWIRCTWSNDTAVVNTIIKIMSGSWEAFGDLQNPYGLVVTTDYKTHYYPAFEERANKLWLIDKKGIGYNRTLTGSGFANQYHQDNRDLFTDLSTCPRNYLLFFHQLPWDMEIEAGLTLREALLYKGTRALRKTEQTRLLWMSLKDKLDNQRYRETLVKIEKQKIDAETFASKRNTFFASYGNSNQR